MKTSGLSLQEAIKSGKPFRRVGYEGWITPCSSNHPLRLEDAIADDWELKPDEPKWERRWLLDLSQLTGLDPRILSRRVSPGDILLIDSRPVKALVDTVKQYFSPYEKDALPIKPIVVAIKQVEQLLEESK